MPDPSSSSNPLQPITPPSIGAIPGGPTGAAPQGDGMHTPIKSMSEMKNVIVQSMGEEKGNELYNKFIKSFVTQMITQMQHFAQRAKTAAAEMRKQH